MKKILKSILFLAIGIGIFLGVQDVLTLNDITGGTPGVVIDDFLNMEEPIDVVFLGMSHTQEGISPMQIYKKTGIVSYDLGCSTQPIECSYFLLKEALKTQHPDMVILDPTSLFYTDSVNRNIAWRYVLDHLPLDDVRVEMSKAYAKKWFSDGELSGILPIIKYHTRWSELTKNDFIKTGESLSYAAGEYPVAISIPGSLTIQGIDYVIEQMAGLPDGYSVMYDGEGMYDKELNTELYSPVISDNNWKYLMGMKELCDENGSELVLITVPSAYMPWLEGHWSSEKSNIMKNAAANAGIMYIDMACDYDLVDMNTDSYDGGHHLNILGSAKVSSAVSDFLLTKLNPSEERNPKYDAMLEIYEQVFNTATLQLEKNFYQYVDLLSQRLDDYTVYMAVCSDYTNGMTDEDKAYVEEKLGLKLFSKGGYCDSYAAVIDKGNVVYEEMSNRAINHSIDIGEAKARLYSSGYFTIPGASITVDGTGYATGGSGINFVVYDKKSGLVIDSVSFETYNPSKPYTRNWSSVNTYLRAYESAVCFD